MSLTKGRPSLYLLHLSRFPIFQQLKIEEALLRADQNNWCIINEGTSPAIVMGVSGDVEQLINPEQFLKFPVPIIRRFSGGGTVYVDEDTYLVSFICNSAAVQVSCCPQKVLHWTEELYRIAFPDLNMLVRENDYVIGEKKVGGNAQYFRKDRWLHHSSLLWDYSLEKMQYLLLPKKMPTYRQKRSHRDFLGSLKAWHSERTLFIQKIVQALEEKFTVQKVAENEVQELLQRPHRQTTTFVNWNPPFFQEEKKDC